VEIPVEIIAAPPPAPAPPPQEKPEAPADKQDSAPAPQPYLEPATDAPRAANDEKIKRETPDEATEAPPTPTPPTAEPNPGGSAGAAPSGPAHEGQPEAAKNAAEPAPDKPDAEAVRAVEAELEKAEQQARAEAQTMPGMAGAEPFPAWSIGRQSPMFDALRDPELGSAAEATFVAGGKAKSTYLTVLYGMIIPHMHSPPVQHPGSAKVEGEIVFSVDGKGNLGAPRIHRSSGFQDLDSAALDAIIHAAPFPAPPHGIPMQLTFTFGAK
jgi:protein TonB